MELAVLLEEERGARREAERAAEEARREAEDARVRVVWSLGGVCRVHAWLKQQGWGGPEGCIRVVNK